MMTVCFSAQWPLKVLPCTSRCMLGWFYHARPAAPHTKKPELETIPTYLSRPGGTRVGSLELTPESAWSRALNLKIWVQTGQMVTSNDVSVQAMHDHLKTRNFDGENPEF